MNLLSYLFPQTLAQYHSDFNGEIFVKEFFGKKYLEVGGLVQSGWAVDSLWRDAILKSKINPSTLLRTRDQKSKIKNILILGLGGGSAAKLLTNIFPQAEIVGVDIDPVMVKAGQKYLGLGEIDQLKTIICDARSYIKKNNHLHDLIIVDLYQGYQVPDFVGSLKFLTDLKHYIGNRKEGYVFLSNRNKQLELVLMNK